MSHAPRVKRKSVCAMRVVIAILALDLACKSDAPSAASVAPGPLAAPERALSEPAYPRGRWRLASFDTLDRTVLWVSHILIRHRDSSDELGFRAQFWTTDQPRATRSKQDAARLSGLLFDELSRDPSSFAAIASLHSEDITSRATGGSLGGVRASQLPPQLLDALQLMQPGDVSRPVATSYGFHILRLAAPPAQEDVAGQRLVVRYKGSTDWEAFGAVERSRDDAYRRSIELGASSHDFAETIGRHSEHSDRVRGGDMGVWSTIAPEHNGAELEALAALKVGETSPPIETRHGFQVIKRIPSTARPELAAQVLRFAYDPKDAASRAKVREVALAALAELKRDASRFDAMRAAHCCESALLWAAGHGEPLLELAVGGLRAGELAPELVDDGWAYVLPKRIDPGSVARPPATLLYTLPAPESADVAAYFEHSSGAALSERVAGLRADAKAFLRLPDGEKSRLDRILSTLQSELMHADAAPQRLAARRRALEALQSTLTPDSAPTVREFVDAWAMAEVMKLRPE
jgi:hypothetical protein